MRNALPDLLATRKGRLTAFFLLYVTEGIPLGFTATAIAAQMRRGGLGPEAIGLFVGSLYLPWALKWAVGPFVDTFSSERWLPPDRSSRCRLYDGDAGSDERDFAGHQAVHGDHLPDNVCRDHGRDDALAVSVLPKTSAARPTASCLRAPRSGRRSAARACSS
jgi:hypothetical protein